jgi:hypothetical protein
VLPGSTRQDRRSISGAGWLLEGPCRFVKREARSHQQDAPRHRGPRGGVGLRPLAVLRQRSVAARVAAEINLGDVIDANPAGDVEGPRREVLER